MSIYTGISGAPVVGLRGVIGVLSGSYDEGGGIGWAIPLKYLQKLTQTRRRPSEIHWPRLTLMATAWRNLRTTVQLNAKANQVFEQYMEDVETIARILDELYEQASTVRLNFLAHRPFLRRVISDQTLSKDWEAANRLLEPTGSQAFRSLRKFNNLSSEYAETGRRLAVNPAKVNTWIRDESGLDDRRGRALGQELRDVRNQLADFTRGIDVYLGIRTEELMATLPALQQGLERTAGKAGDQARVQLSFIDAWTTAIERYASGDALNFITRVVSALRRTARLFEPIVYKVR
jgi:hypothetical protein